MHRLSAVLLAAFALALSAGCTSLSSTVTVVSDTVYPAGGIVTFLLENPNGYMTVTGWDRNEVQILALNGRRVANVSVEVVGSQMTVRTLSAGGIGLEGPHADYEVRVPRQLPRIAVTTANGAIEVGDCNGTIDAETSNGVIRLTGTPRIERLASSNGRIDAEVRSLDTDALVTMSNGAVQLLLAPSLNATVDARTSNGRVTVSALALNATTASSNQLTGTLGAGGNALRVETSNGEITLGSL